MYRPISDGKELENGIKEWFINHETRSTSSATSAVHALRRRDIYTIEELKNLVNSDRDWYKHINGIGPALAFSIENYIHWIQGEPVDIDKEIEELRNKINELNKQLRDKLAKKREMEG